MKRRIVIAAAFLALFASSAFGVNRSLASLSWADQHQTMGTAFGGTAVLVTHFLEGGTEDCTPSNTACYFIAYWGYWNGSGWVQFGSVSHSTDLNWPYNHASRGFGQNWPNLEHGNPGSDTHAESPYFAFYPCFQWVLPYIWAYNNSGSGLSYTNPSSWMYFTAGC